jgi:hypothetical protein
MPQYNALADRPSNMLAYPDTMRATPRNEYLGALADLIAQSYSPVRTQQMQGTARFLSMPAISETLDRLSYGEPLTTGAGGLGGTTRVRPEALEAGMAVAPMAQPVTMASLQAARAARQAALRAGMAGERYAERVVPGIMERGGMPAQMLQDLAQGTQSPLTVYHGSPHKFTKFDSSKIGTGEGAQVYGHGLYLAESPDVARIYSADRAYVGAAMKGQPQAINYDDPAWIAQKTIEELGDSEKALLHLQMVQRTAGKHQSPETKAAVQGALDLIASGNVAPKGSLYKVDLPDEQIAKMLDWDKPLSQQSKEVQKALAKYMDGPETFMSPTSGSLYNPTGKQIYESITGSVDAFSGKGSDISAKKLRDLGIPGVRYLEAGSSNTKQNTSNFVVFPGSEDILQILERNNQPINAMVKNKNR